MDFFRNLPIIIQIIITLPLLFLIYIFYLYLRPIVWSVYLFGRYGEEKGKELLYKKFHKEKEFLDNNKEKRS